MQGFAWIKLGQRFQGAIEDSRAHQWLWDIASEEIDVFNMSMQGLWPLGQSTFKTFRNQANQDAGGSLAQRMVPEASSPLNPLGVKGAGEGGIVATGATIANAVSNA